MKPRKSRRRTRRRRVGEAAAAPNAVSRLVSDVRQHTDTSPRLTGGDVDAAWADASAAGDEAVGGSTATPDQDVVDELGEALGVPQPPDGEVVTAREMLEERDRHRWRIEREIALDERTAEEP